MSEVGARKAVRVRWLDSSRFGQGANNILDDRIFGPWPKLFFANDQT